MSAIFTETDQQTINKFAKKALKKAFIGNNQQFIIRFQKQFSKTPYTPLGGNVLAHASKHRIELKLIGKNIQASIFSSASLPRLDVRLTINKSGITDVL